MRTLFLALALSLCLIRAAASPVAGTWEAADEGHKAVTVNIRETDGILGGTVVFYIIRDNGNGEHNGDATKPLAMHGVAWDGRVLRFSIDPPGGASLSCALTLTGADQGRLEIPGHTLPVTRAKER
jgi:hypothetical protein